MEWSERIRKEIQDQVAVPNGHDLSKLYEVENIVHCADFSARASLERKESRWGAAHRRTDFPDRDDNQWRCHVIVNRGDSPDDINVSTRPVRDLDGKEVSA